MSIAEISHTMIVIVTKCSIKANATECLDLDIAFTICLQNNISHMALDLV